MGNMGGHVSSTKSLTFHILATTTETNNTRTAQGGGGSFKDRKPIGEGACCDACMAEQSH